MLRIFVGCSLAEISEVTGTKEGTVRSRILSAKAKLRKKLDRNPELVAAWRSA